MSTALTIPANVALPAHLQADPSLLALNDAAGGGIKAGGVPSISIKDSKFFIKDPSAEDPMVLITADIGGQRLPTPYLDTVIIAANSGLSKRLYEGPYDPDAEDKSPDCSSDNGLVPDAHIAHPVHSACATCPKNQWGSKVNTENGKETKACADFKRLVAIPSADLKYKALALDVTPAALKEYGAYIRTLSSRNFPVIGVVTRITFDPAASFPKLQFQFLRFLDAAEFEQVKARIDSDEVRNIVAPKRIPIASATPAVQTSVSMPDVTSHNMTATLAAAAAATVAGVPTTPADQAAAAAAINVIQFPNPTSGAPAAPASAPAVTVNFGAPAGTTAPDATKKRGKKADAAAPPGVDSAVAAAAAAVTGTAIDINTVPEPFRAAIIASGGLASEGGKAIYSAMPKTAPAAPAPAQTSFSTAPPGVTVASGGDLNAQLTALLGGKK